MGNKQLLNNKIQNQKEVDNMVMYDINLKNAKLHVIKGNRKIGKTIWSFSTLPGNKDHLLRKKDGVLLTNIPGTCSKYCENCAKDGACYAWRDAKLHHNAVIPAWGENTLLLREGKAFALLEELFTKMNPKDEKPKITMFRINVSGEIENVNELKEWNNLAKKHPEIRFGIYTKNYDALEELIQQNIEIAQNFIINVSEWHGVAKHFLDKHPGLFNVFEYDDSKYEDSTLSEEDKQRLKGTRHCPAVDINGKHTLNKDGEPLTCDQCGYCYTKTGKRTAVYAH